MKRFTMLAAAGALSFLAACGNTADGVKQDAENAADKTAEASANAGAAADAAMETADVKTALIADGRIDAGDINVETNKDTKTVTLNGTVASAEQKTLAEDIAKAQATGYAVVNNLTIKH
jgi:hyperosmotically inducible periplasmic protein